MRVALVGNPNCGKTTLFNAYTGSSQHVGNWPGVTVEKKVGTYRKNKEIHIVDLPGVYSLSPYTSEEVITRDYILNENPDVVINIIDAVNLERNLYLTLQVLEMNVPTVIALNRMDMLDSENIKLDIDALSKKLGVPVLPIVATKNKGIKELMETAEKIGNKKEEVHFNFYSDEMKEIFEKIGNILPENLKVNKLYHSIKIFENDQDAASKHNYSGFINQDIKKIISEAENKFDDDGESIIINEKYNSISKILQGIYSKVSEVKLSTSDKIDKVITNKWLGLPIFFLIMWAVYFVSIKTVGDWTVTWVETGVETIKGWVTAALENASASEAVSSLITDGIIGSMGAIFTYVPQLMILFLFMSILEDSGYMARVAFIMDRLFRKFGLSGKSFIPMLIGTGCSIPGVLASRTIENEKDREMTIMLTPFVPCGAKVPLFAMFIAMMFPNDSWVGPSIYLIAFVGIVLSGIVLKKTKYFAGDPAPFVMELPPYTIPTIKGLLIHMWDKAKGFILKAGSIIFLANLVIWVLMHFSFGLAYLPDEEINNSIIATIGNIIKPIFVPLGFGDTWASPVAAITGLIAKESVVSTFASIGAVLPITFTKVSAFAFMIFNIFAPPCFAAIAAMKKELGSAKKMWFAISFQLGLAYILGTLTNLVGNLIFKGSAITEAVTLDYTQMQEASESMELVNGDYLYGYIALAFLAVSILLILYNQFFRNRKEKHCA